MTRSIFSPIIHPLSMFSHFSCFEENLPARDSLPGLTHCHDTRIE